MEARRSGVQSCPQLSEWGLPVPMIWPGDQSEKQRKYNQSTFWQRERGKIDTIWQKVFLENYLGVEMLQVAGWKSLMQSCLAPCTSVLSFLQKPCSRRVAPFCFEWFPSLGTLLSFICFHSYWVMGAFPAVHFQLPSTTYWRNFLSWCVFLALKLKISYL